jgi:hypothetical protein
MPDVARVWVYAADRHLSEQDQETLAESLRPFLAFWTSHGLPVRAAMTFVGGRFLILAGLVSGDDISGCGIDASIDAVERAARSVGVEWLQGLTVLYRDAEGHVQSTDRPTFRQLVRSGRVTGDTPVFDLSVTQLREVREGGFERPAGSSWHGRVFSIPAPVDHGS